MKNGCFRFAKHVDLSPGTDLNQIKIWKFHPFWPLPFSGHKLWTLVKSQWQRIFLITWQAFGRMQSHPSLWFHWNHFSPMFESINFCLETDKTSSKGIEQYVKLYIIIEPNVRKLGGFGNLWVYILNCKEKRKFKNWNIFMKSSKMYTEVCKICWMYSRAVIVNKNVNVYWHPVSLLNASSKMANMVMLEWFIENVCQIAAKQEGFIIKSRKPFKFILFSNYQALQIISKFTLPARTKLLNF